MPYPYPDLSSSSGILAQTLKIWPQKQQLGIHPSALVPTATILIPEHQRDITNPLIQERFVHQDQVVNQTQQPTATDLQLELDAPISSIVVYDQLSSSLRQAQQPYKHQEWSHSSSHPRGHEQNRTILSLPYPDPSNIPLQTSSDQSQSQTLQSYIPYPDLSFPSNVPLQTSSDQSQTLQSGSDSSPIVPQLLLPTSVSSLSSSQCHSAVTSTKPSNSPLTSGNFSQVHSPTAMQQPVMAAKCSSAKKDSQSNISCPIAQAGISSNEQSHEINTS